MINKLDVAVATDFLMSLGQMIGMALPSDVEANPRQTMLTYATAGDEDSFGESSRKLDMDIVVMAFEPGREREGPTNISVYEQRDGEIVHWPKCTPWAFSSNGPFLLLVEGRDFGFGYAGTSLVMHWDVPTDRLVERVAAGRALLRLLAQRAPAHTKTTRRLEPPIRVVETRRGR